MAVSSSNQHISNLHVNVLQRQRANFAYDLHKSPSPKLLTSLVSRNQKNLSPQYISKKTLVGRAVVTSNYPVDEVYHHEEDSGAEQEQDFLVKATLTEKVKRPLTRIDFQESGPIAQNPPCFYTVGFFSRNCFKEIDL